MDPVALLRHLDPARFGEAIAKLRELGLGFGTCVAEFGAGAEEASLIERAREQYVHEGEVEIDDDPVVSRGDDNGAYVMAWVWVENPEPAENAYDAGREDDYGKNGGPLD
jgi:hypothetical protein